MPATPRLSLNSGAASASERIVMRVQRPGKIQARLTRPQAQGINDSSEVIQHIVYCLRPADVVGRRLGKSLRHCGYSRRESRIGASRT